jgi:hypothetical protein
VLLQYDNARPYVSITTSAAIENIGFKDVLYSPHSLNLAPFDFCFFAALKLHLKGIHFTCDEVQAAVGKWFIEQPERFYSDGLKKNLLSTGRVVGNKRESVWNCEV